MKVPSRVTPEFWKLYRKQLVEVRELARKAYRLWSEESLHPSLHFKKVRGGKWSLRIGVHYRAVGRFEGDGFVWDWIGSHAEYDQLIRGG